MTQRQPSMRDRIESAPQQSLHMRGSPSSGAPAEPRRLRLRPAWAVALLAGLLGTGGGAVWAQSEVPMQMPGQDAMAPRAAWLPFAFSVGQMGAVGVTGRIWHVTADGRVSRATTFNHTEDRPSAHGRLSPAQMVRVSQALADAELDSLPAELRLSLHANPVITVLQLDARRVRLFSPSGQLPTLDAHPDAPDDVRRFVRLQTVLREVLATAVP